MKTPTLLKALAIFAAGVATGAGAPAAAPRMTAQVILEHPGPALLYVLEGELEEIGAGGPRTLRAGQAVWNRGRGPHNVRNRGDRVARALAVHLEPAR